MTTWCFRDLLFSNVQTYSKVSPPVSLPVHRDDLANSFVCLRKAMNKAREPKGGGTGPTPKRNAMPISGEGSSSSLVYYVQSTSTPEGIFHKLVFTQTA